MRQTKNCHLVLMLVLLLIGVASSGCSEKKASETDDKALRKAYGPRAITINDVPPEQRERVKGFMRQGNPEQKK